MGAIQAGRRLSPEEMAERREAILAEAAAAKREVDLRRAAEAKAREIQRQAHAFLAASREAKIGPSLADKLLRASRKGMRVQGPGGRFLSVRKAANG